jgi:hypothetical protein
MIRQEISRFQRKIYKNGNGGFALNIPISIARSLGELNLIVSLFDDGTIQLKPHRIDVDLTKLNIKAESK